MYDVKTVAINAEVRHSQMVIAQEKQSALTQVAVVNQTIQ
jgi:hypothetical protein